MWTEQGAPHGFKCLDGGNTGAVGGRLLLVFHPSSSIPPLFPACQVYCPLPQHPCRLVTAWEEKKNRVPFPGALRNQSLSSLWIANCPSATGLVVSHCANNGCMRAKLLQSSLILQPTRLLCPWYSPGKNTGVGCHALLLGIFSTQG